jgi:hypothetical protein
MGSVTVSVGNCEMMALPDLGAVADPCFVRRLVYEYRILF